MIENNIEIIDDRYRVIKSLGCGGMSEVYLAHDMLLDKEWAIKKISREGILEGKLCVMSAVTEINILKKLDHPSLPRIVDIIEKENEIYVIMDYIAGITLGEYMDNYEHVKEKTVIEWAKQLCDVLIYLHTRKPPIIYRDMKPDNIMLTEEGRIKLIDFGIAREFKQTNDKDTIYLGTRGYAAPEQFGGNGQTDERTDIYCLGVTLYYLLTGKNPAKPPYKIYPIRYWDKKLSHSLEKIIIKSTRENPNERYNSVSYMLSDLNNIKRDSKKYILYQRIKIYIFRGLLCISVSFTGYSYAVKELYDSKSSQYFEECIDRIKTSGDAKYKMELINEAINIKTASLDLWEIMIDYYKADKIFSFEEEKQLLTYYENSLLCDDENNEFNIKKGQLEYDIANLYSYYYQYNVGESIENSEKKINSENSKMGIMASLPWYEKAIADGAGGEENLKRAHIMYDMGMFYKNIISMEKEANDGGKYRAYTENISDMLIYLKDEKNSTIKLKSLYTALAGIDSYLYNIKKDKVERLLLLKICREADTIVRNIDEKDCNKDESDILSLIKIYINQIYKRIPEVY